LANLSKNARYDVRKGLEYATYEQISFGQLASEGWASRRDTLVRQGRESAETRNGWERLCNSAAGLPGFEAWGTLRNNQLIGCLLAFTCDDYFYILYQQSLTSHLKFGINNALAYSVTSDAIKRSVVNQIFYGLHSLDAPKGVDGFKFRMGYNAKSVRQRVVFHPWLEPFINRVTHKFARTVADWKIGSPHIAKAEGLIRFYREGLLPVEQQTLPQFSRDPVTTEE
jgi:hypothetical protein